MLILSTIQQMRYAVGGANPWPFVIFVLLIACQACGVSAPDETSGIRSSPAVNASQPETTPASVSRQMSGTSKQDKKLSDEIDEDGTSEPEEERSQAVVSSIPGAIAEGISSGDVRDRYQALEYWNIKGGNAPLDLVFEAMEDEDEEVRDKATAIVEQRWAEEQEKEDG